LSYASRPLAVPITSTSGANITTEVASITWADGSLPETEFQDFGIMFRLPPSLDGAKFYFPVLQNCVRNRYFLGAYPSIQNWSQIPTGDGAKLSFPAPAMTVFANGTLLKLDTTGLIGSGISNVGSGQVQNSASALGMGGMLTAILAAMITL
jgi:hypothetical protein